MTLRETGFSRAAEGKAAARITSAQEFGRYSKILDRPNRAEAAAAVTFTIANTALEYGKDAVGATLWYGIGVSLAAAEKFAEITGMKKGF